jgi:hypothetical protein
VKKAQQDLRVSLGLQDRKDLQVAKVSLGLQDRKDLQAAKAFLEIQDHKVLLVILVSKAYKVLLVRKEKRVSKELRVLWVKQARLG